MGRNRSGALASAPFLNGSIVGRGVRRPRWFVLLRGDVDDVVAPPRQGVDFVFFDGEEGPLALGAGDPNWEALGSPYFVSHLREVYPNDPPKWAAIFDMVCWRELKLYRETSSLEFAKAMVTKFWNIGWDVDPRVFKLGKAVGPISDDQTALGMAGIPAFLTIDFYYDPWFNTTQDTLDKCSAEKLGVVGKTLMRFLSSD